MLNTLLISSCLLSSYELHDTLSVQNRIVMAPMTMNMASSTHVPTEEMHTHYVARADAGLIISEATMVSKDATAYPYTPGIYTQEQQAAWKNIAQSIQQKGAKFFMQLWHAGRTSHSQYRDGIKPLAPSPIGLKGRINRSELHYEEPKEMDEGDMQQVIQDFAASASRAIEAGCDGVELHAGYGYLLDTFLHYSSNQRCDEYGGSPQNMCRFVLELLDAVSAEIGPQRVAIRLSPKAVINMQDDVRDIEVFKFLLAELSVRNIAYVHAAVDDDTLIYVEANPPLTTSAFLRKYYSGTVIGCGGYDIETATQAIALKKVHLVAFGKLFLASPDFAKQVKLHFSP